VTRRWARRRTTHRGPTRRESVLDIRERHRGFVGAVDLSDVLYGLKIFQNIAPTLRCRPDFVQGMPVARETRRFAVVMPSSRFHENPP